MNNVNSVYEYKILYEIDLSSTEIIEALTTFKSNAVYSIEVSKHEIEGFLLNNNADLVQSIRALSDNISQAIQSASDGSSLESLLFASFVAFIGAFSAYIFNLLHWRMVAKKQNVSGFCKGLIELVKELESSSIEYWTQDCNSQCSNQIHLSEVKIKSNLKLTSRYIGFISTKITDRSASESIHKLKRLNNELFDLITGGEFESKKRKSSKPTAQKISGLSSEIRMLISELIFLV